MSENWDTNVDSMSQRLVMLLDLRHIRGSPTCSGNLGFAVKHWHPISNIPTMSSEQLIYYDERRNIK